MAKLVQVDGSGSTLDADTVDGINSAGFQRAGAAAGGDLAGTYPNPTIRAPEPTHFVGAANQPPFQNGWANFSLLTTGSVGFYKDRGGIVHLTGAAKNDRASGCLLTGVHPAVQLSAGGRSRSPVHPLRQDSAANMQTIRLIVNFDGTIVPVCSSGTPTTILQLDGISFRS